MTTYGERVLCAKNENSRNEENRINKFANKIVYKMKFGVVYATY